MKQVKICLAVVMIVALSVTGFAVAQEKKEKEPVDEQKKPRLTITDAPDGVKVKIIQHKESGPVIEEEPAPPKDMTPEEQAWFKAGQPGEPHNNLAKMAGRWEVTVRYFPTPDAEPQMGRGSAIKEMVLGNRFLQTTYKGEWMGETFIGMGFEGYDNVKKKYTSTWMDTMGTMTYFAEGEANEDGTVFAFYGEYLDPAGNLKKQKSVLTIRSLSMHTIESFEKNEEGDWIKNMDIMYGSVGMR
jgi:hypothetical protein